MRTIALKVAYDGTDWSGFQRLADRPSIQQSLEEALSSVMQHPVNVVCAGRTDAGVHAYGQVVSFQSENRIPIDRIPWVTNRLLPASIMIRQAEDKLSPFHARFSADYRRYWYVLQTNSAKEPIGGRFRWQMKEKLDIERMRTAMSVLIGKHDYQAFSHQIDPQSVTERTVHHARVLVRANGIVIIDLQAKAFLRQMIRLLVANIVLIGRDERPVEWLETLRATRDRHIAGKGAPPCGLYLMRIGYPPTVNPGWGTLMEKLDHEEFFSENT